MIYWDVKIGTTKKFIEYYAKIPMSNPIQEQIPFAQAREMSVVMPIEDRGKADVFIDDITSVAPDLDNNLDRLRAVSCSVHHAFSHKMSDSSTSSIPQDKLRGRAHIHLLTLLLTVMSTNPIFYCNRIDTSNTHSKISSSACCLRKKRKKCDEPVELIVWRL